MPRLREFYGSFKSVCDNLRIDLTEFEQIFGANESSFQIWDTDENGYIDSLELFSGLTLMSTSDFEKKIECNALKLTQSCSISLISMKKENSP